MLTASLIRKRSPGVIHLFLLVIAALFSGCRPAFGAPGGFGAGTPESAALQEIIGRSAMPNFQVDANSAIVRQSVPFNNHFLVIVAFKGTQVGDDIPAGPQKCLFTYEVRRTQLGGWFAQGGGGGCGPANPDGAAEPMSIGGSNHGGDGPGDLGYSTVDGEVLQQDIANVQVTWNDNQVQNVPVINGTYIAVRPGQYNMSKVDGLNEAGEVVFSHQPFAAPGKK